MPAEFQIRILKIWLYCFYGSASLAVALSVWFFPGWWDMIPWDIYRLRVLAIGLGIAGGVSLISGLLVWRSGFC